MNFFEHQDVTRRNTKFLVLLFCLAVLAIVAVIYFAFVATVQYTDFGELYSQMELEHRAGYLDLRRWWQPKILFYCASFTLGVIGIGSLYMMQKLGKGGSAVATMLGGQLLSSQTKDPQERKLLHVVEEMAIASGTPMPQVFILPDEEAINAFAAGFSTSDAAIGVTKGCVTLLTRDELQGVIAHEFSHILNGDMRLNIRLTGVLHGILCIALIGYWILRGSSVRSYSSRRKGGGGIALVGLALLAIGGIGVFFGKLIKSAVSRQREFLADASSVQFTRNPEGITGALKKIGGFSSHSKIKHPHAETMSHMFFGNALKSSFLNAMSTHPPLGDRIRRIDPRFKGKYVQTKSIPLETTYQTPEAMGMAGSPSAAIRATDVSKLIGNPSTKHLQYAGTFLRNLPLAIAEATHEPFGARAVVYGLLIGGDEKTKAIQWNHLKGSSDPLVFRETQKHYPALSQLGGRARLPIIDLALPALRALSPQQYNQFTKNVMVLMKADGQMDFFEFVLIKVLTRHLTPHFSKVDKKRIKYRSLRSVLEDCRTLLSALAFAGTSNDLEAERAFEKGMRRLTSAKAEMGLSQDFRVTDLGRVLDKLAHASPSLKKEILEASVETITADKKVTTEEAELLRAIGDSLDCPIPPILI